MNIGVQCCPSSPLPIPLTKIDFNLGHGPHSNPNSPKLFTFFLGALGPAQLSLPPDYSIYSHLISLLSLSLSSISIILSISYLFCMYMYVIMSCQSVMSCCHVIVSYYLSQSKYDIIWIIYTMNN